MPGFPGPAVAEPDSPVDAELRDELNDELPADAPDDAPDPRFAETDEDAPAAPGESHDPMLTLELRFRCDTMDARQAWNRMFDLIQSALDKDLIFVEGNVCDVVESQFAG